MPKKSAKAAKSNVGVASDEEILRQRRRRRENRFEGFDDIRWKGAGKDVRLSVCISVCVWLCFFNRLISPKVETHDHATLQD